MCAHAPEAIHSTMQTAHMHMLAFLAATVPSHMQVPLTHLPSSRLTPPHALVTFTLAPCPRRRCRPPSVWRTASPSASLAACSAHLVA